MAIRILSHELEHARKALAGIKDGPQIAAMRAINRAMTAGKTQAVKDAAKNYAIKQQQVRERIRTSKATKDNLSATITSRGYALSLTDFKFKPSKPQPGRGSKEVRVNVLKETGFQPIRGAFLQKGQATGKLGIFVRMGKERYPIQKLWGPSIPEILGVKKVAHAVEDRAQDVLNDRFNHEIGRILSRYK